MAESPDPNAPGPQELDRIAARQGNARRMNKRVLVVSTLTAFVLLAGIYFLFWPWPEPEPPIAEAPSPPETTVIIPPAEQAPPQRQAPAQPQAPAGQPAQ